MLAALPPRVLSSSQRGARVAKWVRRSERSEHGVIERYENLDYERARFFRSEYMNFQSVGLTNLTRCARIEFYGHWLSRDPLRPFVARIYHDPAGEHIEELSGLDARRLFGTLLEWDVPREAPGR